MKRRAMVTPKPRNRERHSTLLIWGVWILCSLGAACFKQPPPPPALVLPPLPAVSPWPGILSTAQRLADGGRFAEADRLLADFAVSQPNTPEGAEADFFRALFKSDPLNPDANTRDQLAAFDTYLHGGTSMPRYSEAQVLRRMIEVVDSTQALIVAVRASSAARERAKNDEVRRLLEELEKAVAEMERIKRRLTPKPDEKKPPP